MNTLKNIWIISAIVITSCINENYDLCPDYGKYRVLFYDMDDKKPLVDYFVCITDKNSINKGINTLNEYILPSGATLLKSDKVLKLYPGKYNFIALLSTDKMICLNKKIQLKNNSPYLYTDTSKTIIKQSYNDVILRFTLANSLIQIKCIIDNEYLSRYKISKVALSCPDDDGIFMDFTTGICNYSQTMSEFYEETLYNEQQDIFFIYCVPVVSSNYLNFKISIDDKYQKTENMLFCRIFLNTDISQGKVYQFRFNVTPFEIQYINTSISEWNEKPNISIPLN